MDDPADITSPKTQRRMWRRVWIGLALFLVLTPVVTWVAVDQGGKAEWRRVTANLEAAGVATDFSGLDVPTREDIPDEKNFGALPIFQQAGKSNPPAQIERWQDLLGASWRGTDREIRRRASGKPMLGIAVDFDAIVAQIRAQQGSLLEDWPELEPANEQAGHALAWWNLHLQPVWEEIDAAHDLPFAYLVPLNSELIARNPDRPPAIYHNRATSIALHLGPALRIRALAALKEGDWETTLLCLQLLEKLGTMFSNGLGEHRANMSLICFSYSLDIIAHCLWHEPWRGGDAFLAQCQELFQSWDVPKVLADGVHSDLLMWVESIDWVNRKRSDAESIAAHRGETAWLKIAPSGWYQLNSAYVLDISYRHMYLPLQQQNFRKLSNAKANIAQENSSLSRWAKVNLAWGVFPFGQYPEDYLSRAGHTEAYRQMAIAACAIGRYQNRQQGRIPTTLKALVPDFLDSIPTDPIDGQPLRFQPIEAGEAATYRLWSIGIDGKNDSGKTTVSAEGPAETNLHSATYIGDWTWPSVQRSWGYYDKPAATQ